MRNSQKILNKLQEKEKNKEKALKGLQLNLFEEVEETIVEEKEIIKEEEKLVIEELREVNINRLTPLDAMMLIDKLKKSLEN